MNCVLFVVVSGIRSPPNLIPNGLYSSRLIPPPNGLITSRFIPNGYPLPPPLQPIFTRMGAVPPQAAYLPRDFPTEPRDFLRRGYYTEKGEFRRERTLNLEGDLRDFQEEPKYVKDSRNLESGEVSDKRVIRDVPRDFRESSAAYRDESRGVSVNEFEREFRREPVDRRRDPTSYRNELRVHARESREMQKDFDREYHEFERDNCSNERDSRELARELLDFHREARKREFFRMEMISRRNSREMLQDFNDNSRQLNPNVDSVRQQITSQKEVRSKTRDLQDIRPRDHSRYANSPPDFHPARSPPTAAPISVIRNAVTSSASNYATQNGFISVSRSNAELSRSRLLPISDEGQTSPHEVLARRAGQTSPHETLARRAGQTSPHEALARRAGANVVKLPPVLSPPPESAKKEILPPKERLKKDLRRELSSMAPSPNSKEISVDTVSSPSPASSLSAKEEDTESDVDDTPTPPRSPITLKLKLEPNGNASLKRRQSSSSTDSGTEDVKEGEL